MAPNIFRGRSLRDAAERVASVGLILVPLIVIALWLTVHHKPGWYHPAILDAHGMQRARRQALSTAGSISDQMVRRDAFDVVLTDESVTQWIAALGTIWPDAAARIPQEISEIVIAFDDDVVRIGGRYQGSWQSIVNIRLELGVTEDGLRLWVQQAGVYAGSLAIPRSMIARMLMDRIEAGDSPSGWIRSVSDHFDAAPENRARAEFENRFVWFNGRRPYRILSIQIASGELRLRIKPL